MEIESPAVNRSGRNRILLVDDERNIVSSLSRLLRRDGYEILTANSGAEGLEVLAKTPVAVIVSDQRMPEMTGTEFLMQAKVLHPETIRIILSGYTELESITDAINRGAIYRFLTKPWDDELLRENIREAFKTYGMIDENRRLAEQLREANDALHRRVIVTEFEAELGIKALRIAQEVINEVPVAVLGVDEDNAIVMANRAAHEILGRGVGTLLGLPSESVFPPQVCEAIAAQYRDPTPVTALMVASGGTPLSVLCHGLAPSSGATGVVLIITLHSQKAA